MLAADPPICRPSNSPWASDVVLVKKKEGSMRFAVDYRKLNTVTKRDEYSLPNPQSIFDKLEGSRFFSKLDIASAYWTIPIAPKDVEKTAFHTPRGMYEMLVMPFGLCNAPATFQRVMDRALYRVNHVESYVDDILIFSPDFDSHLSHLREVLKHLQVAGLQLRKEKCQFGFSSVEFLGHRISFEGRTPVPEYTQRLRSFPQPKSVAELQRFLGTANYYRCYIENMSGIAEPLYRLLKTGQQWNWDGKCQTAFEELRARLTNEPVTLAHPAWNSEFYVEADASLVGVAAVLSQLDEETGKLRPIQYFSSSLSPSQKNYSAGQLEAWAIVAATRKWSVYLKGATGVTFLSDHCPLQWLKQQRDPKHTYARWLMELQELPFKIGYRPGKDNHVADYLSRKPHMTYDEHVNNEEVFEDRIFMVNGADNLYQRITEGQAYDEVIQKVLREIAREGRVVSGQLKNISNRLKVTNKVLYFMGRIVVPTALRQDALRLVHAQHHLGQAGTLHSLRRSFFWPRMARSVEAFCNGCVTCQKAKHKSSGRAPMREMRIGQGIPGEAMAMDIGTLPWTDYPGEGYRYFLLMVDLFTRYVEVQPLRDQEASSILAAFQQGWVYRGHGMPSIILTDKGANIDGRAFREFCAKAGIDKRSTTPYHPQSDGMAERNVGLVKQVIRCLQLDRQLAKGSWPGLLTEVSFHINGMENATTRISPHLLNLGREPRSPLDAWCTHIREGERNSHGEYLEALKRKRSELRSIAQENVSRNLGKARARYNEDKRESDIVVGEQVMLKSGQLKDSLSPRYTGPYRVLQRRGPDIKVRLERRDKWVHVDNVKRFRGSQDSTDLRPDETQVLIPTNTDREEQQQLQSPESIEAEQDEQDGYANEQTDHTHISQTFELVLEEDLADS